MDEKLLAEILIGVLYSMLITILIGDRLEKEDLIIEALPDQPDQEK